MSNLFDNFAKVSAAQWKQKIQVDLKGADYNKTLLWKTDEGITVKPFYTKEDRTHQKIQLPKSKFSICQAIFIDDENIANSLAVDALERGATSICFSANSIFNYKKVLANINLINTKIYFNFSFLSSDFVQKISKSYNLKNVFFNNDIVGNLAKTGNWFKNLQNDHEQLKKTVSSTDNSILVDTSIYQNAGANIVQQLTYGLAHANEYLNYFGKEIAYKIHFKFAVGGNYFFEIAKLRAFRTLWSSLLKEYGITDATAHIFTQPTLRNKTLYDYNVNMLRTTSECMSAILGGSNTVCNVSYDAIYHKSNEFGERISRNQLLILQEESGFKSAQDIANGNYYIESITQQLAEKALHIFKQLEKNGGFLQQLKKGSIQKKIQENAEKEQKQFNNKALVLLGSNLQPNPKDKMTNNLELYPFIKKSPTKTLLQPITKKRLSATYEQKRLQLEKDKHGHKK